MSGRTWLDRLAEKPSYAERLRHRHHCEPAVLGESRVVDKTCYTPPQEREGSDHSSKGATAMQVIRSATLAVVMVAAFAGAVMAATGLHQTPPLSAADYRDASCTAPEGKVLWHFVLTQTEADESMLTVTFGYPLYDKSVLSSKNSGGVLHFNVLSDVGDVVVNAVATADGDQLNLSHTCYEEAQPSASPEPSDSPTPSVEPTPTVEPSTSPSPTPSTSPSATPVPSSTPSPTEPTPTVSSSVPATPGMTMPPTDTESQRSETQTGNPDFLVLAAVLAFLTAIFLTPSRRRGR